MIHMYYTLVNKKTESALNLTSALKLRGCSVPQLENPQNDIQLKLNDFILAR